MGKTLLSLNSHADLKKYNEQFAEQVIKSFTEGEKRGVCEEKTQEKIDCFVQKAFYPTDCMAYGGQIVIQPDGYVSNCHASSRYNVSHLDRCDENFKIQKTALAKSWKKRLPLYNQKCLGCEAISICGGGCPWSITEVKGTPFEKDDTLCIYTKRVFEFLLKSKRLKKEKWN